MFVNAWLDSFEDPHMPDDDGEVRGLIHIEMPGNTEVVANEIRPLFSVICSARVQNPEE